MDDLTEPVELLADGGFESGAVPFTADSRTVAAIEATDARSGTRALVLRGDGPGTRSASIRVYPERNEPTDITAWVRADGGETRVGLVGDGPNPEAVWSGWIPAGPAWQPLHLAATLSRPSRSASVTFEARGNGVLTVDDVSVEGRAWPFATCEGSCARVGSIDVPTPPRAPVLFALAIHVEDQPALREGTTAFAETTLVLERMAAIVHAHGGRLTIQPESDWVEGALAEADRTGDETAVARLERVDHAIWSTHAHGPRCVDPSGAGHPASDCVAHAEWRAAGDSDVPAYIRARQDLIVRAGGRRPTDHNGSFALEDLGLLAGARVAELSGFKDPATQRGLPSLYTNPWRPAAGAGDLAHFVADDPAGPVVYLPGIGPGLPRHPERLEDGAARALSQVLRYADPDRVNTSYLILNAGMFAPSDAKDRASYFRSGGLDADLAYLDATLTDVVDPLVAGGWLRWSTFPEMGDAFRRWEKGCRRRR